MNDYNIFEKQAYFRLVESKMTRADERFRLLDDDGLFWSLTKLCTRHIARILRFLLFYSVVRRLGKKADWIAKTVLKTDRTYERTFEIATDVWKFLIFIVDIGVYAGTWVITKFDLPNGTRLVALIFAFWAIARLAQLLSLIATVTLQRDYSFSEIARPVFNTMWHYATVVLLYGVLFQVIYFLDPRAIAIDNGSRFNDSCLTAVYFSTITIATVGYGDLYPVTWAARCAAISEIGVGMFLVLIIIQRVFSAQRPMVPNE